LKKDLTVIHIGLSPKAGDKIRTILEDSLNGDYPKEYTDVVDAVIDTIDEQMPKKSKKKKR